jgi:hypothetical protein
MKEHPVYNKILVTKDGNVYSMGKNYKTPRKLKESFDERGYVRVRVQVGLYEQKQRSVHRLVAETYLPNPNNLCEVHHKDNNPMNNNLDNLEWVTHKQNCQYSRDNIGQNKAAEWKILNIKSNETFVVKNLSKWCEENGLNKANLHKTLKKKNHHKGYRILEKISS